MKKYNIIDRLKSANERPFIQVTDDISYEVNTSKTTALHMQVIYKDEDLSDEQRLDQIIKITLGEKAAEEIEKMNLSLPATSLLVETIAAALSGEELDEVSDRFQKAEITE